MADLTGGDFTKFTVIKNEDLDELTYSGLMKEQLKFICNLIEHNRKTRGKKTGHKYLVINVDEPYADEIIAILKKNGHWG
ncbi:MAG: hypothetical protein PWQ37_11 [Candidatus Petromonas sp.]|jgi:hypothetical protein|nr:hypothetical protein [Candidatus Petromonas sp.]